MEISDIPAKLGELSNRASKTQRGPVFLLGEWTL